MKKLEELLLDQHREFWYDIYNVEKKEIICLKEYIDYIDKDLRCYENAGISYKGVSNLFMNKHLDYLKEAFLSIIIGNYNSFAACMRTIIENYIGFMLIKKYRNKNVWKDWCLWSFFKTIKSLESFSNREAIDKFKNSFKELCNEMKIDKNSISNMEFYGWLKRVKKMDKYNFKSACNLIEPELYKDFSFFSSYIHNNDIISKTNWVDMIFLTKFIYFAYEITDKMITSYRYTFTTRTQYRYLCVKLLESLNVCTNYSEI